MVSPEVTYLRSTRAIRERCGEVLAAGLAGRLAHFDVDMARLSEAATITAEVTRERYPDLQVPPHSRFGHFDAGGVARLARLRAQLSTLDLLEQARCLMDVVVTSVLLDAGAGPAWSYREADSGTCLGRSEGLALASLAWTGSGGLSSRGQSHAVDAAALREVDAPALAAAFQVSDENPLVGVEGRAHLLRELGRTLEQREDVFTSAHRVGGLVDTLHARSEGGALRAQQILEAVLDGLGGIWPGRMELHGQPLGDVWRHPAAAGEGETRGLVPLHKLSQWLSYSLIHPLEVSGLRIVDLDALTGLAEYRNGGLFVDTGVLVPRHPAVTEQAHEVSSETIVEWRALTVALLDRIAEPVRQLLGVDAEELPLAAVLEGGTWAAGRRLAKQRRADGGPPIRVVSDGTVF